MCVRVCVGGGEGGGEERKGVHRGTTFSLAPLPKGVQTDPWSMKYTHTHTHMQTDIQTERERDIHTHLVKERVSEREKERQ